jgi:hypothetical protein
MTFLARKAADLYQRVLNVDPSIIPTFRHEDTHRTCPPSWGKAMNYRCDCRTLRILAVVCKGSDIVRKSIGFLVVLGNEILCAAFL